MYFFLGPKKFTTEVRMMNEKDFVVEDKGDGKEFGVYSLRDYSKGELITIVSGEIVDEPGLHTLQLTPDKHLHDPHFTGVLLHACDPKAVIIPEKREVWARRDIRAGDAITVDYRTTEDRIVKQFPCSCGEPNCRRWIMGRKETINEEGAAYLSTYNKEP